MANPVDKKWVQQELIPFLDLAFNLLSCHKPKKTEEWETVITRAETRINTIRNYDDSIITIDRIRLVLIASPNATSEDRAQVSPIILDEDLIITMFVRHAITHGPYPIESLGIDKNPEAEKEREALWESEQPVPEVFKPNARGGRLVGTASHADVNNQQAFPQLYCQEGFGLEDPFVSPPERDTPPQLATNYPFSGPRSGYTDMIPNPMHVVAGQGSMSAVEALHLSVGMVPRSSSASTMPTPSSMQSQDSFADYNKGVITEGHSRQQDYQDPFLAPQQRLRMHAPEFVPGAQVHHTMHVPEFIPGAEEHVTLRMAGHEPFYY